MKNSTILILVFFLFFAGSCKKDSGQPTNIAPTNLNVTATVSADGSGNVAFKATADNAVSYGYEFGNGDTKTIASGITGYQYTLVGTITYSVTVTATGTGVTQADIDAQLVKVQDAIDKLKIFPVIGLGISYSF